MNYFDDLEITFVSHFISRSSGRIYTCSDNIWGIGLMQSNGCVSSYNHYSTQKIKTPFLYLSFPNQSSGWKLSEGSTRDNRWFIMDGERGKRMISAFLEFCSKEYPFIPVENCQELVRIHQKMLELFQHGIPAKKYKLAQCAEEFAGAIYDTLLAPRYRSPLSRKMTQIVERICQNPAMNETIEDYAAECHISTDHFRHRFQQFTGVPIHEFQLQKRLERGISLLRSSSCSIKEISDQCGFLRQAEFARFIKKRTGKIPSDFRE